MIQPTLFPVDNPDALDYWPTPAWCTELLLPHLPIGAVFLEPCAGNGAIARVLTRAAGCEQVWCSDPHEQPDRCEAGAHGVSLWWLRRPVDATYPDDLERLFEAALPTTMHRGCIVSNPPYSLAFDVVRACVASGLPTWMLLRLAFLESQERAPWLRQHPPRVLVLSRRPSFSADGKSDSSAYAWFGWNVDGAGTIGWL